MLPICGVVADVAPAGEQIVKPASQEEAEEDALANPDIERRNKYVSERILKLKVMCEGK